MNAIPLASCAATPSTFSKYGSQYAPSSDRNCPFFEYSWKGVTCTYIKQNNFSCPSLTSFLTRKSGSDTNVVTSSTEITNIEECKTIDDIETDTTVNVEMVNIQKTFSASSSTYSSFATTNRSKTVLHDINGSVKAGELVAIIGPSGCGKSTLLDILAQRKTIGNLEGEFYVNYEPIRPKQLKNISSYVTQEDRFYPTQTVLSVVLFFAHLTLSRKLSLQVKEELARAVIKYVGLQGKEFQLIGGVMDNNKVVKGLSGGERRRLSLACGLITEPDILLLDEITSGLDSFAALQVMLFVRRYIHGPRCGLCVIHQPRQDIWKLFDHVFVLSKGHLMYAGKSSTRALDSWFGDTLGYSRGTESSIVDYVLDLINIDFHPEETIEEIEEEEDKKKSPNGSIIPGTTSRKVTLEKTTMLTEADLLEASNLFINQYDMFKAHNDVEENCSTIMETASSTLNALKGFKSTVQDSDYDSMYSPMSYDRINKFWYRFKHVFRRNLYLTLSNPGNALMRIMTGLVMALMNGYIYYGTVQKAAESFFTAWDALGASYVSLYSIAVLPFVSLPIMLYNRNFYFQEVASGLYQSSEVILVQVIIEIVLNSFVGLVFGFVSCYMLGFHALEYDYFNEETNEILRHPLGFSSFDAIGYFVLTCVLLTVACHSIAVLISMLCPSFESLAGVYSFYVAISNLTGGFAVTFPTMKESSAWLQHLSIIKYSYQIVANLILKTAALQNPAIIQMEEDLQLNEPGFFTCISALVIMIFLPILITFLLAVSGFQKENR